MMVDHPYLIEQTLKHIFGLATYTPPSTMYLALAAVEPGPADTGADLHEPDDASYRRLPTYAGDWIVDDLGRAINTTTLQFDPASTNWPTMNCLVLCDAPVGGNILKHDPISPVTVAAGNRFTLAAAGSVRFAWGDECLLSVPWRRIVQGFVFKGQRVAAVVDMALRLLSSAPNPTGRVIDNAQFSDFHASPIELPTGPTYWSWQNGAIVNTRTISIKANSDWPPVTHLAITSGMWGGLVIVDLPQINPISMTAGNTLYISAGGIEVGYQVV